MQTLIDIIRKGKESKSYTHVNNSDFEIKYNDMDTYLILLWINIKSDKYKGIEVFKALVKFSQEKNLKFIIAYASKGIFYKVETTGYYSLLKWGFIPLEGIDLINAALEGNYKSIEEARKDSKFLANWKEKGIAFDGIFELDNIN